MDSLKVIQIHIYYGFIRERRFGFVNTSVNIILNSIVTKKCLFDFLFNCV